MVGPDGDGKKSGGSKFAEQIAPSSPLYLHPSESTALSLTPTVFNGENYDLWADAVRNALDAKNKLSFVEGKVRKPHVKDGEEESLEAVAWRQCNAMVKAWIRNSIDPKLHPSISFPGAVTEIWKELKDRYSCTCGAAADLAKEKEEEKVHQFLMGLDTSLYGNIRTNLLMEDEITTLNRAYALVLREERHRAVTKPKEENSEAAMAARLISGASRGRDSTVQNSETREGIPRCTACNKLYHTEDNCWDKYPELRPGRGRGRGRRGGRGQGRGGRGQGGNHQAANVSTTSEGERNLTVEEVIQIRNLLGAKSDGNQANSGMDCDINNWLIDSGASHHMTGRKSLLANISIQNPSTVTLPDGSKIIAREHGELVLSDNFVLKDVLYVPKLTCDLISVKQLIEENNCVVTFFPDHCTIQDRSTRMKIGRVLHGTQPVLDDLRVFGSLCYAHNKDRPKDKFNERGKRCVFIGYPSSKKGWRVYDIKSRKIFESRDVIFYEHTFPFVDNGSMGINEEGARPKMNEQIVADPHFVSPSSHQEVEELVPGETNDEEQGGLNEEEQAGPDMSSSPPAE
ncbi:uncharacterized protein LOC141606139 [Silene latifolia]|uniref:uncharacterized protein LOC141606139 n=1 Tax=Silene latifolia TaxID=37657 RepID=UPI003D779FE1